MAITDKEKGVWGLDQVYNKINQGSIWEYTGMSGLWSWGYNSKGQQGQNSPTAYYSSPTQVGSDPFVHISKGYFEARYYLATTSGGKMYSWGWNNKGQLGQNDDTGDGKSSPIQIGSDTTWNHGCHGSNSSVAVKTDGTLWAWGYNASGELGLNNKTDYSSPVQIGSGTDWATAYGSHAFSQYNVHSIKTDGTLWSWGYNGFGQLGQNSQSENVTYSSPVQIPGTTWTTSIGLLNGEDRFVLVGKTDGTIWGWGSNIQGQLGQNNRTAYSSPVQVGSGSWGTTSISGNVYASAFTGQL